MSFEITRGLAAFDCPDHYATLGVSINASSNEIRKRYLKIARSLHPDSCGPGVDKAQASRVLSKLVNPAYEALSQEKERDEYRVLLRLISQRTNIEKDRTALQENSAQDLLNASDFETFYQDTVQQLAQKQYQSLEHIQAVVTRLSELNLAYLLRREHQQTQAAQPTYARAAAVTVDQTIVAPAPSAPAPASPPASAPAPDSPTQTAAPDTASRTTYPGTSTDATSPGSSATSTFSGQRDTTHPGPQGNQFVDQYCRRAEELIAKNRFPQAIRELRDALKLSPKSCRCHSLLGTIYLKQQQLTMAKVHFSQALKINPQEPDALQGMDKLKKLDKKRQASQKETAKQSERKGLFGLFGGKK